MSIQFNFAGYWYLIYTLYIYFKLYFRTELGILLNPYAAHCLVPITSTTQSIILHFLKTNKQDNAEVANQGRRNHQVTVGIQHCIDKCNCQDC